MKVFTVLGTEQMFMKCFCFFVLLFPVICVCFHGLSHVWRHGNTWYHMIWIYILTSHVISHGTLFWSRTGHGNQPKMYNCDIVFGVLVWTYCNYAFFRTPSSCNCDSLVSFFWRNRAVWSIVHLLYVFAPMLSFTMVAAKQFYFNFLAIIVPVVCHRYGHNWSWGHRCGIRLTNGFKEEEEKEGKI